jgi:hypothetical protein
MLVYRCTVAGAIVTGALLVGCTAPDLPTDLSTDGPPNVTTVTVMSDLKTSVDPRPPSLSRLIESATFCRLGDDKRPSLVGLPNFSTTQVCPDDRAAKAPQEGAVEGVPPSWFARVVFDKLLDPSVEDLIPVDPLMPDGAKTGTLLNTQPITLTCDGVAVPYSGYYVPNGNSFSWPLGPALFIQPISAVSVPTGASCTVAIKDMVHNKDGEAVPSDQRSFAFKIAPMALRFSAPDPKDGDPGDISLDPDEPVRYYWTAAFSTMPAPADIKIFSAPNLNTTAASDGDPDLAVCNGGGTPVPEADISTSIEPPRMGASAATIATTTALVMDLQVKTNLPPPDDEHTWKPKTTYRIEFPNAKITPKQGGPDGDFTARGRYGAAGYSLCFHTTAPAT